MKKFLLAALAVLFLCQPAAFAANTATAQAALPIRLGGNRGPVTPYVVSFDTTASDLTIVTPDSDKMACIVGIAMSETSATNITVKSGSTTQVVYELAANQGFGEGIGNHAVICTQPGEALKMQVSVAVTSMLVYVIQAAYLDFTGR